MTGERLPDAPTVHVRLDVDPGCAEHPRWYLGERVQLVEDHGDGWASLRHRSGKVWRHWLDQCRTARRY